jgi:hypothetical protein
LYFKEGSHVVWCDGGQVPYADRVAWICRLGTNLQVRVAKGSADCLWVANLASGVEVVLSTENLFGGELTEIIGNGNLLGQESG